MTPEVRGPQTAAPQRCGDTVGASPLSSLYISSLPQRSSKGNDHSESWVYTSQAPTTSELLQQKATREQQPQCGMCSPHLSLHRTQPLFSNQCFFPPRNWCCHLWALCHLREGLLLPNQTSVITWPRMNWTETRADSDILQSLTRLSWSMTQIGCHCQKHSTLLTITQPDKE